MPIRLVVRVPRGATTEVTEHTFTRGKIVVGRSPDCDLVLPGDEIRVSRQHVRVERREAGYLLVDLGSRNGTLLNDKLVEPNSTTPLNETDIVKMGNIEMVVAAVTLDNGTSARQAAVRISRETDAVKASPLGDAALAALQSVSRFFLKTDDFHTPQQIERFGEMIRISLDTLMEGLFTVLSARKEFEGEFDASVTMAFQREANPLKQVQQLENFKMMPLNWKSDATLGDIQDNLARATKDIAQHQMGVLAGMQQVLDAIIKRLDPGEIERAAMAKAGLLARMSKAKAAWHEYLETYSQFLAESSKLFNEMVFPNLQKGYLLSHKERTKVIKNAAEFAKKAEERAQAAMQSAADLRASDPEA